MYLISLTSLFYYYFFLSQHFFKAFMPVINLIDCKIKETTATYLFVPYMASKSTILSNISIFEELNIN